MPLKKKKKKANRKRRTRTHIIADLSANHVERHALINGYSVESIVKDYGYDLNVYTYNSNGEFENGSIFIQLKATDRPKHDAKKTALTFSADKRDLRTWFDEPYPVILVIYDAKNEIGYWLYVQQYLRSLKGFDLNKIGDSFTLKIPKTNIVDTTAFITMRNYKINILKEINSVITYS
ncbi:MAG: DUF4365 domain-containing protein [Bacteroidota bacterium]